MIERLKMETKIVTWKVNSNRCLVSFLFSFFLLISTVIADHFNPRSRFVLFFVFFSVAFTFLCMKLWADNMVWSDCFQRHEQRMTRYTSPALTENCPAIVSTRRCSQFKCKIFPFFSFDAVYFIILLPVSRTEYHDNGGLL